MHNLLYIRTYLLNILQKRYTQELKKIHGPELEDPRSVPSTSMLRMLRAEAPRLEGISKYQLFSANYCQFIKLSLLQACFE
jgi:hypothetical protein